MIHYLFAFVYTFFENKTNIVGKAPRLFRKFGKNSRKLPSPPVRFQNMRGKPFSAKYPRGRRRRDLARTAKCNPPPSVLPL